MSKLMSQLGLAQRAGKLVTGDEIVLKAIRGSQAQLVIVAGMHPRTRRRSFGISANRTVFRWPSDLTETDWEAASASRSGSCWLY